ncbi:hypothetical protein CDL12_06592 [Handroanthus impetiginosus]|uniref:EF-hand domain-containing protein n=1 Tax=Handroanthus impetiginosus TaxID=429701 RepID=A0A2G9HTW3_9LAMI|nr:hypothetical protein CDL12_06592 [Handroanthus impetiginosus]
MASYTGKTRPYSPSAPPAPDPEHPPVAYPYQPSPPPANPYLPYAPIAAQHSSSSFGAGPINPPPQGYGYNPYHHQPPQPQQNLYSSFPPGTHPDVIRSFQMVDRNQNGYIEENELQEALAWNYPKFSRRTLRFLIFLFRNSRESSGRIGPKEFADVWSCLGQWRVSKESDVWFILSL